MCFPFVCRHKVRAEERQTSEIVDKLNKRTQQLQKSERRVHQLRFEVRCVVFRLSPILMIVLMFHFIQRNITHPVKYNGQEPRAAFKDTPS